MSAISKITPHFGLKFNQSIDNFNVFQLSYLLEHYKLLVFSKQTFDEKKLTDLSNSIGQLLSPISKVSNIAELGDFGSDILPWHTDLIHSYENSIPGLMLYAHTLPEDQQTVTRFADLDWVKSKIGEDLKNLRVIHKSDDRYGGWNGHDAHYSENLLIKKNSRGSYLTFSPAHWSNFPDLSDQKKKEVYQTLVDLIKHPNNVYEHYWQVGDLLLIDNERLSHHRDRITSTLPRILLRSTLFYKHQLT